MKKLLAKIKMFFARIFCAEILGEYRRSLDMNENLIQQLHEKKIWVQCKTFELDSDEFIHFFESLFYDDRYTFLMTFLKDMVTEEIIRAPVDKLDKLRGQLQGLELMRMMIEKIKNSKNLQGKIKEQVGV